MIRDLDEYRIVLKYYQAGVLNDTRNTVFQIANEDDLSLTLGRNEQFEGVFQEFSGTFIFCLSDRDWIIEKRNDYLSRLDAETKLIIEFYQLNTTTLMYDLSYTGRLEFKNLSLPDYYIECQFYEDNLINKLNRIQDTPITVEKDGDEYDYLIPMVAKYDAIYDAEWSNFVWNSRLEDDTSTTTPKITQLTPSIVSKLISPDSSRDIYDFFNKGIIYFDENASIVIKAGTTAELDISDVYSYFSGESAVVDIEMKIRIKYDPSDSGTWEEFYIFNINEAITVNSSTITYTTVSDVVVDINKYKLVKDIEETIISTIDFVISPTYSLTSLSGTPPTSAIDLDDSFTVSNYEASLSFNNYLSTSKITAHEFRDVLDDYEALLGIDINTDALTGTVYESMLLTTSRGVKGIKPLNYNIQFNTLFNSLKSFMALSLEQGTNTVYLKPIADAYDDSEVIDLGELTDLEIVQSDKIYNTLTIGNSGGGSANFDYGDLDPLAQATYDLGLDDETKKAFENDVRVDAATINKAAIDFEKVTTSIADRDEDRDLYLIAYDPSESTIRSNFTTVSGLDIKKFGQGINLEFTKSRQLYNWRNYLGHLFTANSEYTLKSWDKNKDLVYNDTEITEDITDTPDTIRKLCPFISKYANITTQELEIPITAFTKIEIEFKSNASRYVIGRYLSNVYVGAYNGSGGFYSSNSGTTTYTTTPSDHYEFSVLVIDNIDSSLYSKLYISGYSGFEFVSDIRYIKIHNGIEKVFDADFEYINGTTIFDSSGKGNDAIISGTLTDFIQDDADTESSRSRDGYGINSGVIVPRLNDGINDYLPLSQQKDIFGGDLIRGCQPIFGTNIYNTELPITTEIKSKIYNNKNKIFKFAFKGSNYYGYFDNGEYNPLIQEGGSFKFIQAAI